MDTISRKVLTPDRLDVDPNLPTAEKQYSHWRRNFIYFLEDSHEAATASTAGGEASTAPVANQERFNLRSLTKYVSYAVYEYIANCSTYTEALAVLDKLFLKKKNEIF